MTDETNPILALIDKAVEEKTFSLDALTAIQKIKEQATSLNTRLQNTTHAYESQKTETYNEQARAKRAEEQLKKWEAREQALLAREAKVTELEKNTAVAQAQSTTYSQVMNLMFANRQFRETVMESTTKPMAMPSGGFTQTMNESSTTTTDRSDIK